MSGSRNIEGYLRLSVKAINTPLQATLQVCVLAAFLGCARPTDQGNGDPQGSLPVDPYTATVMLNKVRSVDLEWSLESILVTLSTFRVDSKGHFVWMESNPPIYVFDADGKFLRTLGSRGDGPEEFGSTDAMGIDKEGYIRVFDGDRRRISVLSPDYEFVGDYSVDKERIKHLTINSNGHTVLLREAWWASSAPAVVTIDAEGRHISDASEIPTWAKVQLNVFPAGGIGVDAEDNVYHTYVTSHRIWKSNAEGSILDVFDTQPRSYYKASDFKTLARIDRPGNQRATQDRIRYVDFVSRTSGLFVVPEKDLVIQEIINPIAEDGSAVRFDLEFWHTAGFKMATGVRSHPRLVFADSNYLYYVSYRGGEEQNPAIDLYEYTLVPTVSDPNESHQPREAPAEPT